MKILSRIALISLFAAALGAHGKNVQSSTSGDVCDIRPDLCGGAPVKKKKSKRQISRHESAHAGDDLEKDFDEMTDEPAPRRATRRPASLPNAVMDYDSYLQMNNTHPAIARRPASMAMNQKAFVAPVRKATITGSTLDQPPASNAAPAAPGSPGALDASPSATGVNPGDIPSPNN